MYCMMSWQQNAPGDASVFSHSLNPLLLHLSLEQRWHFIGTRGVMCPGISGWFCLKAPTGLRRQSATWESLPAWGTEGKEREVEYGCVRRIEWGQGEGERETVLNDHKLLLPLGATHTAYHRGTGAWPQHGSLHQSLGAVLCFKVTLTGGEMLFLMTSVPETLQLHIYKSWSQICTCSSFKSVFNAATCAAYRVSGDENFMTALE